MFVLVVYRYCIIVLRIWFYSIYFLLRQYLVLYSALLSCLDYCSYSLIFLLCCCPSQIKIHSLIH